MKRNGFSERLKGLITQKGIAMSQIAQAIGVSATSVHRWTQGGEIEYENLLALANHLKVNWVWLRYGDEAIRLASETAPDTDAESNMRRKYLDQVMENERRMKTALEMAQIVNWEWNAISSTISCSANAKLVFGCEPESIREALLPFNKLPLEALSALFSGKQVHFWDFQLTTKEGAVRWFTSRAHLLADSNNIPIKVIAITADITEHKETERALERSEYMLRKIIETMPVGLWVANKDGDITIANPEVKRIWGGAKMVGLDEYNLYKGKWAKDGSRLGGRDWTLARAVTKGETSKQEIVDIEAFDGVERTIIMFATPLLNNNNEIIGAIEVNQDITAIKQTEYLLKKSHDQLESLYRQDEFGVLHFSNAGIQRVSALILSLLNKERGCLENQPIDSIFDSETVARIVERKDSADLSAKIQGHLLNSAGKSVVPVNVWIYLIKHPDYSVGGDMMAFLFPRKD